MKAPSFRGAALAGIALAMAIPGIAHAASSDRRPSDRVTSDTFEARPASQPVYGAVGPEPHTVLAADGAALHVDVWLPEQRDGRQPPRKLPVILVQTPYDGLIGDVQGSRAALAEYVGRHYARHGYAVAIASDRGTGRSAGCADVLAGPIQVEDSLRIVEYLATTPEWASGRVGMLGFSNDGLNAVAAAVADDWPRARYIRALVVGGTWISAYDWYHLDGIPRWGNASLTPLIRGGFGVPADPMRPGVELLSGRTSCHDGTVEMSNPSGDFVPFWQVRDHRSRLANLRAATLIMQGLGDQQGLLPVTTSGFLDRIPGRTSHKVVIGQWAHDPEFFYTGATDHLPAGERRSDWPDMARAWFDRYLMDLPTQVEDWPAVQVQSQTSDGVDGIYGRWREEVAWPTTGGPVGHFALGPDGQLGVTSPTGETAYHETPSGSAVTDKGTPAVATFESEPLRDALHITGQPSLQLWVRLENPDAHVTAVLEAYDEGGDRIGARRLGGVLEDTVFGGRSVRHLDPMVDGGFRQAEGRDARTGPPILVPIRLSPVDLAIPKGGRLRLTVGGNLNFGGHDEMIGSGSIGAVTVVHDCEHPSVLRFTMVRPEPRWLRVPGSPTNDVAQSASVDGGGRATEPVCGEPPARDDIVGPERQPHRTSRVRGIP